MGLLGREVIKEELQTTGQFLSFDRRITEEPEHTQGSEKAEPFEVNRMFEAPKPAPLNLNNLTRAQIKKLLQLDIITPQ